MAQFLTSYLDPVLRAYEEKVLNNPSPHEHARAAPGAGREMEVLDGQLTWLVYMVGAVIGGHAATELHGSTEGQEAVDASLASRCLMLAQGLNARAQQTGGIEPPPCSPRLELALVYFFQVRGLL